MPVHPDSKLLIVGSGVFGISTALWLARDAGCRDVTVFDMQDTEAAGYDPAAGVDSASADLNKIVRFSYGSEVEYQRLASEAAGLWREWNQQLEVAVAAAAGQHDDSPPPPLPSVLKRGSPRLWNNAGFLRVSSGDRFSDFELQTLESMEREGVRDTQFRSDDAADIQRAQDRGWAHKLDPSARQARLGVHKAVLDSSAGYVEAYKSCAWAQHLARKAGVKFVLHPTRGKAVRINTPSPPQDEGGGDGGKPSIETADGVVHTADLVLVACGGWTPSLVPEADGLLETTAGSVATIQLPPDRPDLWHRYAPENFPVMGWGMRDDKSSYSFPRDDNGVIKIGFRGTKYTNYDVVDGRRISVPKTAHVTAKKETNLPRKSIDAIKEFISVNLPELAELGLASTKLCWYTDSIDNSFVVDFVPGRPGLAVASGGSGHGFKFLPILGREVTKILLGQGDQSVYGAMWKWRRSTASKRNGLEEGESGPRVLSKQDMSTPADWAPPTRASTV